LVALGLRPDGKKEVIDFRLAQSESAAEWERFLGDLIRRGLIGDKFEMICVDGGSGLLAALPTAYPGVPVQRCWAHKIRNVLAKVRLADQPAVKADLHAIMNAKTLPKARSAARRFADRWQLDYLKAVACLRDDLDELLTCWRYRSLAQRKRVRTTNAMQPGSAFTMAAALAADRISGVCQHSVRGRSCGAMPRPCARGAIHRRCAWRPCRGSSRPVSS
jgi:transposase-like protein